jgi:hypothetical protein
MARGLAYWLARRAKSGTPEGEETRQQYRTALAASGITHEQVQQAAGSDAMLRPAQREAA